ncbi:GLUG motif-containing protein [Planctomycetota bacterium]
MEYTDEDLPAGVFYYSISAVYKDGQEHLTPYEVKALVFSEGTGEPNDPYQIASAEQLVSIADFPTLTDKNFVLINNIDLDPSLMGEAAFKRSVIPSFAGTLNGNGFTIGNMTIMSNSHRPVTHCLGLFGTIENGGLVLNLGVVDAKINAQGEDIGIIAGHNNGTVSNCYSTGAVSGDSGVGGLVGYNSGSITMSYSTGTVSGHQIVGGLVGMNDDSVSNCYSTGVVSGHVGVGGLVGYNHIGSITVSYSAGTVSGTGYAVGGLAGFNHSSITMSYSTGSVTGDRSVGGLVGWNTSDRGSIIASYSTGSVTGDSLVGGLVGRNDESSVMSCFWDMETSRQPTSASGMGLTTAEMQTESTFTNADWDFINETENGTEDIWWIDEGQDYPRLWWEQ